MNIVLDIGNTFIKAGAFEENVLIWKQVYTDISEVISKVNETRPQILFISSVRKDLHFPELEKSTKVMYFDTLLNLPIRLEYTTPKTLGSDRIAAAVGAATLYPNQNTLFFDIGTCLTHGFIDHTNTYFGGSISPGLDMRFKALAHFTQKLPLIEMSTEIVALTGKSTSESINSGVINGMQFEINGFIEEYQNKYPSINVLLTGGSACLFEKRLKEYIFVVPELNLIGLNRILNYNVY